MSYNLSFKLVPSLSHFVKVDFSCWKPYDRAEIIEFTEDLETVTW